MTSEALDHCKKLADNNPKKYTGILNGIMDELKEIQSKVEDEDA